MAAKHDVLSKEYVSSLTKRYKQGKNLFSVLTVLFAVLGILMQFAPRVSSTDFIILTFVSIAILSIIQGRHDTLLENKRLWDRGNAAADAVAQ